MTDAFLSNFPVKILQRLQRLFDQLLQRGLGLGIADGADAFVRFGLLIAERDEGEDGVVDVLFLGRKALLRGGGFPGGGDADFVAQLDDDPLGGLFADAFDPAQRRDVARDDEAAKDDRRDAVEDGQRKLWPDAADVVDEQEKEIPFFLGGKAVEDVGVFADLEMGEDFGFRAGLGELVEGSVQSQPEGRGN